MTAPAATSASKASVRSPGSRPRSSSWLRASSTGTPRRSGTATGCDAERDDVVDGGAGCDLGAGGGVGADDGARGDLGVEGIAPLAGLEAQVEQLVEGILDGHAAQVGDGDGCRGRDRLDAERHDVVDGGAGCDLGVGGGVGADDGARGDLGVEGIAALAGLEAQVEQLVEGILDGHAAQVGRRCRDGRLDAERDDVVDGGAGCDLGAGGGVGADDGARGDVVVEGIAALAGLEAQVEQLVEGILDGHAAQVGDGDGCRGGRRLDAERDDVVDGGAGGDLGAGGGVGADDGARGDLGVEGIAALAGLEAQVEQLVEGILDGHAAQVGDGDGAGVGVGSMPSDTT